MLKFKFGYDTETYTLFSSSSSNITRVGCCGKKIITLYNKLIKARGIFSSKTKCKAASNKLVLLI